MPDGEIAPQVQYVSGEVGEEREDVCGFLFRSHHAVDLPFAFSYGLGSGGGNNAQFGHRIAGMA